MFFWDFIKAAVEGNLQEINELIECNQDDVQEMIGKYKFEAFSLAARHGHLDVMERLLDLAQDRVQDMVSANNFEAFRRAAYNGHLNVMERLIKLAPDRVQDMVSAEDFEAFRWAEKINRLNIMERLIKLAPDRVQDMVSANNFEAFRGAAKSGDLNLMERLIELAPDRVQDMVSESFFHAFRSAAHNGHLHVMERLLELAQDGVQDMVSACNFEAFRSAAHNGHLNVMERLMNFPAVFAYAEMHADEYGRYTQSFVDKALESLQKDINAFNIEYPNSVFDIDDTEKAKLYFYFMRNFIRQNTPKSLNQLNLLLSISSVKASAHTESNELLRLAMSLNNAEAAAILLNIPEVRTLAEANDFYRREQQGGLDLSEFARDRESSMKALTQGEQQRLEDVQQKYQPEMSSRGVPAIMRELKDLLVTRYLAKPAVVSAGDRRDIELPLEFHDYQELVKTLSDETREQALKSYYQHPDHTAYRYLSKPNPWMSTSAHYVNRDNTGAWSTFEEYQPLISLMYLAAKDESTPAMNGYTTATRVENFIKELGLIGRAHNWDATRYHPTTDQPEEYDDLEGDKPSCYSGVKRRLFQSVQGHPLLALLTNDTLHQEVREIVREHFINRITDENCVELNKAWEAITDGDTEADTSILNKLNFTEKELHQHISSISEKYGSKLDRDLMAYLYRTINVMAPFKNLAEKFGGETDLTGILQQKLTTLPKKELSQGRERLMFFGNASSSADNQSSKHQAPKK